MENKIFKVGEKVRIKDYGSVMWATKNRPTFLEIKKENIVSENDNIIWHDINPELVGKTGTINKVFETMNDNELSAKYSIIPDWDEKEAILKTSWYSQNQLELI